MRRTVLALLLLSLNALAASGASAADSSAAVQRDVEQALAQLARLDPSQGFSYGAVEVVPNRGAYGITVADVAAKLAATDPGVLDIGIVSFRLSPLGDNTYRVDRVSAADEFSH